jgi:branched-chain amino acid transport system permease protein
MSGWLLYLTALLTMGGIYAVLTLGLNLHWGVGGLFNAGIAGLFAVGAYTSALLTAAPSPDHVGGFGLPVPVGWAAAMLLAGAVAWPIGRICLRLQSDYLAMATIGIAEILRLVVKNELWLTNGSRGISAVPRPFEGLAQPWSELAFLALVLGLVAVLYVLLERAVRSPWGRVMRAIRDDEQAAAAAGKDVAAFRLQAFVLGSMLMGLGGALSAHYFKYIGPEATQPLLATFLVWVMLIVGGSGRNAGAVVGAFVIWTIWSATELLTNRLPPDWLTRASYVRVLLIGLLLQLVLQRFGGGILRERVGRRGRDVTRPIF